MKITQTALFTMYFTLHSQKKSLNLLLLQITLTGGDVFQVKEGDRYGFTWLDLGVIDFDYTSGDNYCENAAQFNVGAQVNLVPRRHGKRFYSISMKLTPKCGGCGKSN